MRKLSLPDKAYGNLLKFILDENITDINWSQGLWVNDLNKGRYKIKGFTLDDNFIQQFYTRISNLMNVQFNKNNPLLEAETDNLRIRSKRRRGPVPNGKYFCRRTLPDHSAS